MISLWEYLFYLRDILELYLTAFLPEDCDPELLYKCANALSTGVWVLICQSRPRDHHTCLLLNALSYQPVDLEDCPSPYKNNSFVLSETTMPVILAHYCHFWRQSGLWSNSVIWGALLYVVRHYGASCATDTAYSDVWRGPWRLMLNITAFETLECSMP
jgi:hypothetical protein